MLPKWAYYVIISITGCLLLMFVHDIKAQGEKVNKAEIDIKLLQQSIEYEIRDINKQLVGIGDTQSDLKVTVRSNADKIDRIGGLIERMADKQGIQ